MYKTNPTEDGQNSFVETQGTILYTVWSDVYICPHCGNEIVFYDAAVDSETGKVADNFKCSACGATLKKRDCDNAFDTYFDEKTNDTRRIIKQRPVLIAYQFGGKR